MNSRIIGFALGMLLALGGIVALVPMELTWQPSDLLIFLMLSASALGVVCIAVIAMEPEIPEE